MDKGVKDNESLQIPLRHITKVNCRLDIYHTTYLSNIDRKMITLN